MPRSPTTPETVEKATDTFKEQQATSQPQKWTMNGFPRQSSTAWHTTSLVHSGPVTSPPLLTHHPCQPRETTSLSTPPPQLLMAERPAQCQTLPLHRTLPDSTRQHQQTCSVCSKRFQRPRQRERVTHVQRTRQQQQTSNSDCQKNRWRRQCSSRQVKTGSKQQNNQ